MFTVTDSVFYIKGNSGNPLKDELSSDVVFIKENDVTWIFDTGSSVEAFEEIQKISGKKNIVLSHFHPDHIANCKKVSFTNLFLTENTARYIEGGTVIKERTSFGNIELIPLVSSHAKGCLALKYGNYAFLGDATYACIKNGGKSYNVQKLKEEIEILKSIDADFFCLSHDRIFIREKKTVLNLLESIYSQKKNNEPYIPV